MTGLVIVGRPSHESLLRPGRVPLILSALLAAGPTNSLLLNPLRYRQTDMG